MKDKLIEVLKPFAEHTKFADSEGPGYLRRKDWEALKTVYDNLLKAQPEDSADKRCHVCHTAIGKNHASICSVGNGIFYG